MRHRTLFILSLLFSTTLFASTAMSNNAEMPGASLTPAQMQACFAAHQHQMTPPADCPKAETMQSHLSTCQKAYQNHTTPLPEGCPTLQEVQQKAQMIRGQAM